MDTNRNHLEVCFFIFSIAIYPLARIIGNFSMSRIIVFFYAVVMIFQVYILYHYKPSRKQIFTLVGVYLLYAILFLTADERVRSEFMSLKMIMIYCYYLPIFVLIVSRIADFSWIFEQPKIALLTDALIIASFLSKYFLNDQTNYMMYSYWLLPFWVLVVERFVRLQSLHNYVMLFICLLEAVIYGARGPLLWLCLAFMMFIILYMFYETKKIRNYSLLGRVIFIICISLIAIQLLSSWLNIFDAESSYILRRISRGIFTKSTGRAANYEIFFEYLPTMGIDIKGVFYDKLIMTGGSYSHNFILETMISFGLLLGPILLLILVGVMTYSFFISDYQGKKVWIFFTCTFFLQYFVSGSIYSSYGFLLYISVLASLIQRVHVKKKLLVIEV